MNIGQIVKGRQMYSCIECDYTAGRYKVKQHIESKQMGIKFCCEQCGYKSSNPTSLFHHKKLIHEGVAYNCNFCEYTAPTTVHSIFV